MIIIMLATTPLYSYKILYAEQYYKLYHKHLHQYPHETQENIFYLGMALRSDFCNPLYAISKIENKTEYEKYRYLFYMHINLRLVDSYLMLAAKFDKFKAYFYNAPWKEQNLKSLEIAETYYNMARKYWADAVMWSEKSSQRQYRWLTLTDIQKWEDENWRIQEGELDYDAIIDRQLKRLYGVRAEFEAMDPEWTAP